MTKISFYSISKDIIINIIANIIPVAVLQFVALPFIGNNLGREANGLFLTILAILHLIISITSSSLSVARLLLNKEYENRKNAGDFNLYLLIYAIFNIAIVFISCFTYSASISFTDILMICMLSLMWMIKDYLLVEFRLTLTYAKILINNIILSIGLLIGIFVFRYIPQWYVIFLCGYTVAFIHAFFSTTLLREPVRKTDFFPHLSNVIIKLIAANILGILAVNLDRLLLYPLAGGTSVSIYYSASVIGKIMTLISAPVSNVFLSYFVKVDQIPIKIRRYMFLISIGIGAIVYVIIIFISPFLLNLLYPSWCDDSLRYVPITSAIAVFELVVAVTNPIVLKSCNINYQIKLQLIYFLFYAGGGFVLYHLFGLSGFAVGGLIATIIKMIFIYIYSTKKQTSLQTQ